MEMPQKDEIYWKILNSAITLEIRHGHQRWSITQLAKHSRISRTLIYYYFGKSKLDILKEAISLVGNEFSGETAERVSLWKQGKLAETFCASRKLIQQTPALIPFYFLNRHQDNELGKLIRKKETVFQRKIMQFFPGLKPADYEGMFALFCGISFSRDLSDQGVHCAIHILLSGTKGKHSLPVSLN